MQRFPDKPVITRPVRVRSLNLIEDLKFFFAELMRSPPRQQRSGVNWEKMEGERKKWRIFN
jgi:hypothetical protein